MGYLLIIIASVMYGVGPTFSTLMQRSGWNAATILFEGELVGAVLLFLLIKGRGLSLRLKREQVLPLLGLGGLSYLLMSMLLQSSYRYMLAGLCTMLHFIYPIIVMVIMIAIFKERVTASKLLCMLLALLGICMIVGLPGQPVEGNVPLGAALAASSGIAYAIFVVSNDRSAMAEVDAMVSTFYVLVVGGILVGLYLLLTGNFSANLEGANAIYAIVYPLFSVVALVCLARGVHCVGATRAAIINMLEPAVSMAVSVLVFGGSDVTAFTICGCVLIVASVITVTLTKDAVRAQEVLEPCGEKR